MRHGASSNPANRFDRVIAVPDLSDLDDEDQQLLQSGTQPVEYLEDSTQQIVSTNRSPDVPFTYSLNPYRGCLHGCAYCYARPSHEYLGMSAGLDFETRIVVKRDAAELFRNFLSKPSWKPESIAFSGVTDCYQPAERHFRLTRACLRVAAEFGQPISIVTKNALVLRDLELLQSLAQRRLVHVYLSITTLSKELAGTMEPRTSTPTARLRAVRELAEADVPVGVMVAPIIPGLTDSEIPNVLQAAHDAGATTAHYTLLRLPLTVEPVFLDWLQRTQPNHADRVIGLIRQARDGRLNSSEWGDRMSGRGPIADQIKSIFKVFRKRLGLDKAMPAYDLTQFRPPHNGRQQLTLF